MKKPVATITMQDGGTINIELYPDKAPDTVNNFIALANKGFYNGLTFHRIISTFMIQGGDPKGDGTGGPGYSIRGEFAVAGFKQNDLKHTKGVISMARQGSQYNDAPYHNTAGSQFFIMTAESYPSLDGKYAAFGKVVDDESMKVVMGIAKTPVSPRDQSTPLEAPKIKSVTVETFGENFPEPQKIKG